MKINTLIKELQKFNSNEIACIFDIKGEWLGDIKFISQNADCIELRLDKLRLEV